MVISQALEISTFINRIRVDSHVKTNRIPYFRAVICLSRILCFAYSSRFVCALAICGLWIWFMEIIRNMNNKHRIYFPDFLCANRSTAESVLELLPTHSFKYDNFCHQNQTERLWQWNSENRILCCYVANVCQCRVIGVKISLEFLPVAMSWADTQINSEKIPAHWHAIIGIFERNRGATDKEQKTDLIELKQARKMSRKFYKNDVVRMFHVSIYRAAGDIADYRHCCWAHTKKEWESWLEPGKMSYEKKR